MLFIKLYVFFVRNVNVLFYTESVQNVSLVLKVRSTLLVG